MTHPLQKPLQHTFLKANAADKMQPLLRIYSTSITYFCGMLKLKIGFGFFKMLFTHNTDVSVRITLVFADEVMLRILADPICPNGHTVPLTLGWRALTANTLTHILCPVVAVFYAKTSVSQDTYCFGGVLLFGPLVL